MAQRGHRHPRHRRHQPPGDDPFTVVSIGAGATFAYDNTQAVHGGLSYKLATVASADTWVTWPIQGAAAQVWFRLYLYVTSNPVAAYRLVTFLRGGTRCAYVRVNTNGTLGFVNNGSTSMCATAGTVPLNTWCRVEGYLTGSVAAGRAELKLFTAVDGVTPLETVTSAVNQTTAGIPDTADWGMIGTANTAHFWIDDLGLSVTGIWARRAGVPRHPHRHGGVPAVRGDGEQPQRAYHPACCGGHRQRPGPTVIAEVDRPSPPRW